MSFIIKKAQRQKAKLRIGVFGASGSGKTISSLYLAYGLCQDWSKICVIDTENQSADLYANFTPKNSETLGEYNTLTLESPFTPERYIEAIKACESAGIEVIVIDSISHEWEGKGGILEIKEQLDLGGGNSYTNWGKVTPRHNAFIQTALTSNSHIVITSRVKTDVALITNDKGKAVPTKVGLKAVTRDGIDYEMTVCFDIEAGSHLAKCSKDRTGIFQDRPEWIISSQDGELLSKWSNSGCDVIERPLSKDEFLQEVVKYSRETKTSYQDSVKLFLREAESDLAQVPESERRNRLKEVRTAQGV
jgi:hypothetical protein